MCSIVGLGICGKHRLLGREEALEKFMTNLLLEGQTRGRDATGLCAVTNKRVLYIKQRLPASSFIETTEYKKFIDEVIKINNGDESEGLISIIGHNRAKTKGTKFINKNNHPIVAGHIVGVHNGGIYNDESLFEEYAETLSEKREGTVDSEIIFQLINFFYNVEVNRHNVTFKHEAFESAIRQTAKKIKGGYACATINRKLPYKLGLFRNNNPIETILFEDLGLFSFASCRNFITEAFNCSFEKEDVGPETKIEVQRESALMLDLKNNAYRKMQL